MWNYSVVDLSWVWHMFYSASSDIHFSCNSFLGSLAISNTPQQTTMAWSINWWPAVEGPSLGVGLVPLRDISTGWEATTPTITKLLGTKWVLSHPITTPCQIDLTICRSIGLSRNSFMPENSLPAGDWSIRRYETNVYYLVRILIEFKRVLIFRMQRLDEIFLFLLLL